MSALLQVRGLSKAYPGVIANKDVDLTVREGEIHALLGENGAGKSTLVKAIYGLLKPDAGRMELAGKPFAPSEPRAARRAGVAMVFQHFSLFEALSVAENVALGMERPPGRSKLSAEIAQVSRAYGLPLDPGRRVGDLSAGERQRVEIVRCLLQEPRLLIMDEPTSVLTPQEVEILFATLRKLAREGTAILYISHKLGEIRALCKQATILRRGRVVGACDPRGVSATQLAELMVGSALKRPDREGRKRGPVVLALKGMSAPAPGRFGTALSDIRLTLEGGEILGIGGVAGNGQDELLAALSGETVVGPRMIEFEGADIGTLGTVARRKLGLLAAPEERLGHAAAPDMSLTENAALTGWMREPIVRRGMIRWRAARDFATRVIEGFDVRTPGPATPARALSGGNLQKFVIGREVLQRPRVLVVNQPTWGVDAAAASAIRQALIDLAKGGAGVIVITQDLDEILELADRFAALNAGRLTHPVPTEGLTMERIGLMLGGAHDMDVARPREAHEIRERHDAPA